MQDAFGAKSHNSHMGLQSSSEPLSPDMMPSRGGNTVGYGDSGLWTSASDPLVRHGLERVSVLGNFKESDSNSRFLDTEIMELFSRARSQEEETVLLRKQVADACAKELQLLNEKHVLERKLSDLRMALDETRGDVISNSMKELTQRKDYLEENLQLSNDLRVAEEEIYIFTSSLLSLLADYDIRPPGINSSTITTASKRLYQHVQWKIRTFSVIATSRRQIVQRERRPPNEEMEQNLLHLAPTPASISQSTVNCDTAQNQILSKSHIAQRACRAREGNAQNLQPQPIAKRSRVERILSSQSAQGTALPALPLSTDEILQREMRARQMGATTSSEPFTNEGNLQGPSTSSHDQMPITSRRQIVQRARRTTTEERHTNFQRLSPVPEQIESISQSPGSSDDINHMLGNRLDDAASKKNQQPSSSSRSQLSQPHMSIYPNELPVESTPNHSGYVQDNDSTHTKEVNVAPIPEMYYPFISNKTKELPSTIYKERASIDPNFSEDSTTVAKSRRVDTENKLYMSSMHETQASSVSEGDVLPSIEGFQIIGEAKPGCTLQACGYPTNGTSLCIFQWVRHLQDGTRQSVEGATVPDYVVTADDVDTFLAVDCIPIDERGRQGELVRRFANNQNKITCDPDMQHEIDAHTSAGRAIFNVLLWIDSSEDWEPTTLILKRSSYQVKVSATDDIVAEEKYSADLYIKVPYGLSTQFVQICSNGTSLPFNTDGTSQPYSMASDIRLRDIIVLTMRIFQTKALDGKRKSKA